MGRLATNIAAVATDADNLPSGEKLPSVSFIDALLPRRCSNLASPREDKDKKPLDSNIGRKTYVTYYDVRKNRKGSKSIIAHKSPSPSAASGDGKGGGEEVGHGKKANKKDAEEKGGDGKGGGGGGGGDKKAEKDWTPEEDAKLKELKAANTSWKDIVAEMNRPKYQLQNRFKELSKADEGGGGGGGGKAENEQKDSGGGKKGKKGGGGGGADGEGEDNKPAKGKQGKKQDEAAVAAAVQKREDRQRKKAQASSKPDSSKAPSSNKPNPKPNNDHAPDARFTMSEWLTLQEDELFSFSELQCLSEIIMRDQKQSWLRIASGFFDLTGRKVHPEDVREKFEGMAGLG